VTATELLVILLASAGCVTTDTALSLPTVDASVFRSSVYPILLADCGFPACHGTSQRPFSIFGPGRTRLLAETMPYDPATPAELAHSFTRAQSMLLGPDGVRRSPLLRKPLAISAGGAGHYGEDPWGNNLYLTKTDPHFIVLFFWATSEGQTR
jgi:hypothetical protein